MEASHTPVSPADCNTNIEELVRVFMAEHRQEMKDILYDGCEQAVQTIALRTLSSCMKLRETASPTPDNGKHLAVLEPDHRVQMAAYPQVYAVVATDEEIPPSPKHIGEPLLMHSHSLALVEDGKEESRLKSKKARFSRHGSVRHNRASRASTRPGFKNMDTEKKKEEKTLGQGIFADGEAMKERLRAAMTEPTYDVADYYHETGFCQAIATSTAMENVTLFVIGLNALWISVDVDLNKASIVTDSDPIFQIVDQFFCLFFTFEIAARFGAFASKRNCLKDAWFVFDATLCLLMVFETWVLPIIVAIFSTKTGNDSVGDASLLKGLRLVRLVRMARMVRLLRALPELMVVIKGLYVATRAVSCTIILMLIIIYVFAVFFRQMSDGTALGEMFFPTVPTTMRYLLLQGTMPDLYEAVTKIWDEGVFYAFVLLFFILITSITVMNMLVGVLVGVVNTVAAVEKEQLMISFVKDHLLSLLKAMNEEDSDSDGLISRREFTKLIQNPDAIRSFTAMGVDVVGLVDLADFLFQDDSVGIPFHGFMEMIMQLRGSNQATVKDIVDLRRFMTMELRMVIRMMEQVNPSCVDVLGAPSCCSMGMPSLPFGGVSSQPKPKTTAKVSDEVSVQDKPEVQNSQEGKAIGKTLSGSRDSIDGQDGNAAIDTSEVSVAVDKKRKFKKRESKGVLKNHHSSYNSS